jgi:hypothetical protein
MEDRTRDSIVGIVTKQDDLYCLTTEDGTYGLSRNVGKELPFCAEYNRKRARVALAQRRKLEIAFSKFLFMNAKIDKAHNIG